MEGFSQHVQHGSGKGFVFIRQTKPNMLYLDLKGANDNRTR